MGFLVIDNMAEFRNDLLASTSLVYTKRLEILEPCKLEFTIFLFSLANNLFPGWLKMLIMELYILTIR